MTRRWRRCTRSIGRDHDRNKDKTLKGIINVNIKKIILKVRITINDKKSIKIKVNLLTRMNIPPISYPITLRLVHPQTTITCLPLKIISLTRISSILSITHPIIIIMISKPIKYIIIVGRSTTAIE